jgi:hypothetical protein
MKQRELIEAVGKGCAICGRKVGQTGLPLFYMVSVERFGLKARAIDRSNALATFLGSGVLAAAMGPDEDLAEQIGETSRVMVCEGCSTSSQSSCVAHLHASARPIDDADGGINDESEGYHR